MPQTTTELLAGRDTLAYYEPFLAANTFPTDSAWSTAPGGSWVLGSYTKDGVHVMYRQQIQEYTIDQFLDAIVTIPISRDLRFRYNASQLDMPELLVATGQGSASATAAGSGTRGKADFLLGATVAQNFYTMYFDTRSPTTAEAGRFVGWKCRAVGDIELAVHIPEQLLVNVELRAFPDDSVTPARIAQFRLLQPALP